MNVSGGGGGGHSGQLSQDFDLNLAPIIDCFTVLITFLLVSASFLAVGFLDAGAGIPGQAAATNAKPPAITLEVELEPDHVIRIKVTGKGKLERRIAAKASDWDLDQLKSELDGIKRKWPDTNSVILSAKNDIEYESVIRAMEASKKSIPAVLLGGF